MCGMNVHAEQSTKECLIMIVMYKMETKIDGMDSNIIYVGFVVINIPLIHDKILIHDVILIHNEKNEKKFIQ